MLRNISEILKDDSRDQILTEKMLISPRYFGNKIIVEVDAGTGDTGQLEIFMYFEPDTA